MDDAAALAPNIRNADRCEMWASHMMKPLPAMQLGLRYSKEAWTGLCDGEPVCMWGVRRDALIFSSGTPWMITANALERFAVARPFLVMGRELMSDLIRRYRYLSNYVDVRNTRSIRWLEYMGFTVHAEAAPYGLMSLPFRHFEMGG